MRPEYHNLELFQGGLRIIVADVPMSVCPNCGERYVPGPIAVELSAAIDELVRNIESATRDSGVVIAEELCVRRTTRKGELAFA